MKLFKRISAFTAAAVMAVSMAVVASATTYQDAVDAAKKAGVPEKNVSELEKFLEPNKDKFTSAQYDEMIAELNKIKDAYVVPHLSQVGAASTEALTADQKKAIGKLWSNTEKDAIANALIALGAKYNVTVTVKDLYTAAPSVTAAINGNTQTGSDKPVANTGAESPAAGAAAAAVATLAFAGTALAITAKKNRD
ncbi:MAG: hypothetical protein IJ806_03435 [Ruminococcus sp.]|nr:hypothetical protein [Ruminococcus sp.]